MPQFRWIGRRLEEACFLQDMVCGDAQRADNACVAAAILDRLLHHAAVINIKGKSFRMRRHEPALDKRKGGKVD